MAYPSCKWPENVYNGFSLPSALVEFFLFFFFTDLIFTVDRFSTVFKWDFKSQILTRPNSDQAAAKMVLLNWWLYKHIMYFVWASIVNHQREPYCTTYSYPINASKMLYGWWIHNWSLRTDAIRIKFFITTTAAVSWIVFVLFFFQSFAQIGKLEHYRHVNLSYQTSRLFMNASCVPEKLFGIFDYPGFSQGTIKYLEVEYSQQNFHQIWKVRSMQLLSSYVNFFLHKISMFQFSVFENIYRLIYTNFRGRFSRVVEEKGIMLFRFMFTI